MYLWYCRSERCYVYLTDVSSNWTTAQCVPFRESRWFTRGWTLQELIAPTIVEFYSLEGNSLGDKHSRLQEIAGITAIPIEGLQAKDMSLFSIEDRMAWTKKRITTREEDMAYCLLGIFDVHMPLIYGEGKARALRRLQREIEENRAYKSRLESQKLAARAEAEADSKIIELPRKRPSTKSNTHALSLGDIEGGDVHRILFAIQDQIKGLSNQLNHKQPEPQSGSSASADRSDDDDTSSGFLESMERLEGLVLQEGNVYDEEAEPLIDDLECVLSSASIPLDVRPLSSGKRRLDVTESNDINSRDIKRLRGIVNSSQAITVNGAAPRSKLLATKRKFEQKRKVREIITNGYRITIIISQRRIPSPKSIQSRPKVRSDNLENIARVQILKSVGAQTVVTAYLQQIQGNSNAYSLFPVISISPTLPALSPIFDIVRDGNVTQLRALLSEGQYTLRTRDSFGTPLLHYALGQPDMCKFLAENGADVDEVAKDAIEGVNFTSPLLQHIQARRQDDPLRMVECSRLLLEAGADPTIEVDTNNNDSNSSTGNSALFNIISNGSFDSIKVMLDHGGPFIDLEAKDRSGRTLLLMACTNTSQDQFANTLELLLDRGADIKARDNDGRNCLHISLTETKTWRKAAREDLHALTLLIRRGADVLCTTNAGTSLFDLVDPTDHKGDMCDGYRAELLDVALSEWGYRPVTDLGVYVRRMGYMGKEKRTEEWYTEENFVERWEGERRYCETCAYEDWYSHEDWMLELEQERQAMEDALDFEDPDDRLSEWNNDTEEDESDWEDDDDDDESRSSRSDRSDEDEW